MMGSKKGVGGRGRGVTMVNYRFYESQNNTFNSLRSGKKSDHNAVKFSCKLNFRHSRFISYLCTIHIQGLLHFIPHGIHSKHDSRNSFVSNHDSQSTKTRIIAASRKYPYPPPPPPPPPPFPHRNSSNYKKTDWAGAVFVSKIKGSSEFTTRP